MATEDAMVPRLRDLTLEITRRCPMRCVLCSSNGGEAQNGELTFEQLCKVIDDAALLGCRSFTLSGGEPLVRPESLALCRYVKESGARCVVYTCGTVFEGNERKVVPEQVFSSLAAIGVDKVVFSIHGGDCETHDAVTTVAGGFDNMVASLGLARKAGLLTELHFVPTLMNLKQLPGVVAIALRTGASGVSILRFVAQGRGAKKRNELELGPAARKALADSIREVRGTGSLPIRVGAHYADLGLAEGAVCTAGISKATMQPDGHLVPCAGLKEIWAPNFGNDVVAKGLPAAWADSTVMRVARREVAVIRASCRGISTDESCEGSCPAQRLAGAARRQQSEQRPACVAALSAANEASPSW